MPYAESEVRVVKVFFVLLMWNTVKETMKYAKYALAISHLLGETTVAKDFYSNSYKRSAQILQKTTPPMMHCAVLFQLQM